MLFSLGSGCFGIALLHRRGGILGALVGGLKVLFREALGVALAVVSGDEPVFRVSLENDVLLEQLKIILFNPRDFALGRDKPLVRNVRAAVDLDIAAVSQCVKLIGAQSAVDVDAHFGLNMKKAGAKAPAKPVSERKKTG
ncbi:hypothetical protein [Bordetella avium]|uniref:hypothetical protein n=2 Tax=Bordetella avium TaxID=521 RepID=UPI0013B40F8F|nr:hypothetical protein [Bordetella avium]WQE34701.1 hypothetical protein U0029_06040 [Bordetella avium]